MKSPADFLLGVLFTVTQMTFWYGGMAILFIEHAIIRYWWVFAACGLSFMLGRMV